MSKISNKKNKQKRGMPTEIIVAIIAGVFAFGAALITAGPSWVSTIRGNRNPLFATSTPSWPPLPIVIGTPLPTEASSPLRLSKFEVGGLDAFFDSGITAANASHLPEDQKIIATTDGISFSFTITSTAPTEWVRFDNQILFRVNNVKTLPQGDRQNIIRRGLPLGPPGTGGTGHYIGFWLFVEGPLQASDILISPPTKDADYFTLQPGETMSFIINSKWFIPPGIYSISLGIRYDYKGNSRMIWSSTNCEIISPENPLIWVYRQNGWESSSP